MTDIPKPQGNADHAPKKVETPGLVLSNGSILEECWDGKCAYFYLKSNMPMLKDNPPERVEEKFDSENNSLLIPLVDDILRKGLVKLPSKPIEYESETRLYQDIKDFINKWVDLKETDAEVQALWIMQTWVHQKAPQLVINGIRAASESGKTRLAETVRHTSYRGMRTSGTLTYSSLFRTVEAWQGTILVNEADMKGSDETNRIVKWLNESIDPNGAVWVTNPNTLKPECYKTFTPVILVSRKSFDDDALESRCLITNMAETTRIDIPLNLPPKFYEEAEQLRNQLLMFRFKNYHRFENDYELRFGDIGSRLNQIMQPLGSLAKIVSPEMFNEIESIAKECQARLVADRAESIDGLVVRGYFKLEKTHEITSTKIAEEIDKMGRQDITPAKVGRRLANLPFEKYSSKDGKTKPWRVVSEKRDLLIRKYVPQDEARDLSQRTLDQEDGSGQIGQIGQKIPGGVPVKIPSISLDERVNTIRNLIEKRPTTIDDIKTMLPDHYLAALKLRENGELITKPDGTLAIKS